jgi:hypothetical protein
MRRSSRRAHIPKQSCKEAQEFVRGARMQTIGVERENAMSREKNAIEVTDAQIAVRAYERWLERGCPISDGADDWFAARSQIEAEQAATPRSAPRRISKAKSRRPVS